MDILHGHREIHTNDLQTLSLFWVFIPQDFYIMSSGTAFTPSLSPELLAMIRGEVSIEKKEQQYDASLSSWWKEYAGRKNDEEHEHVADSLLYDERCHLPRTVPAPSCVKDSSTNKVNEKKE